MSTSPLSSTERTRIRRAPERAASDRESLYALLDAGRICHLGVIVGGSPRVIPTGYGRDGDTLYIHGSTGATSLRAGEICVTVTLLDGLVLARSVFHHSMNYRSAVILGKAKLVLDADAKMHGLKVLTDHLAPGSWEHAREVSPKEFAAVSVLSLDLAEASVKMRAEGPDDEPDDVGADTAWAGVLPVRTVFGAPEPSTDLSPGWTIPAHVTDRE